MKKQANNKKPVSKKKDLPGYPLYPQSEDIFNQGKPVDLDPDDGSVEKDIPEDQMQGLNEKEWGVIVTGADLDVPGSELDDEMEDIGEEDEENNYYSLGGDTFD